MKRIQVLLFLGGPAFWSKPTHAATIFSDLGSGGTYESNSFWSIFGSAVPSNPPGPFSSASAFTPSASYDLTEIDLGVTYFPGTNSVTVTLNSDSGSDSPGTVLESWTLDNRSAFGSTGSILQMAMPKGEHHSHFWRPILGRGESQPRVKIT
jgi:hypothetical protein